MNSEWERTTLGAICSAQAGSIQTGPFGSQLHTSDYTESGTPVVMPTNIGDGGIFEDGIARVGSEDVERLSQHKLQVGDIVFSRRGDVTKNALIRRHEAGWLCGTGCLKVRLGDESKAIAEFISYSLRLPETKEWLKRHAVGATMPNLNTGILSAVPIMLPPLKHQHEIAGILSIFDKRIEMLRESNVTLETIAQALFKSWFVDFDPVRAKAEGREPEGMDAETSAFFPDGLEESALGLVPKGWKVLALHDAYEINPTRKLKKSEMAPYLDMASVGTQGHVVSGLIEREMASGTKFINGDTLLARITPCLENGKTAYVDFLLNNQTGWGSTEFVVLRPKAPLPLYHGYLLARHPPFREYAILSMSGTSGRQRVQNDVLGRYPIVIPTTKIGEMFGEITSSLQQRIAANHEQAQTLAQLRDTLLPKLISGQLRLDEAKDVLDEAAA